VDIQQKQYDEITYKGIRWLLLFVFYLQFLIPVLLELKWDKYTDVPVPEFLLVMSIQLFAVFVPCVVFIYLNNASVKESFKLKNITLLQGVMCAFIGITAQSVASILNVPALIFIKSKTGQFPSSTVPAPQNVGQLLLFLITVAMVPAIFEELLMRGIVLTATQNKGYRASLFIGGLYFALLHNQIESIAGHFFLGVLLCYIVWMTQSVFGGIIAHFCFNSSGMLLHYLTTVKGTAIPWLVSNGFYMGITIASAVLFFLFLGTINRKRVKRNKSQRLKLQLIFSVINFPVMLIVLGYIMFQLVRY
jgi:membrane protease YdiL (CAAX protease family)